MGSPCPDPALAGEVGEQGDGLDGLPQAHLIRENAVQRLVVAAHQPVQSHVLVLAEGVLHVGARVDIES